MVRSTLERLLAIVVFLLLGCSLNSGAAQDVSIDRGRDLLLHGDYKTAISVFNSLLDKKAGDKEAQTGLLQALMETGDYLSAESKARSYLAQNRDEPALQNVLGEILLATGRYQQASAEFDRAASLSKSASGAASRSAAGAEWLSATLGHARALLAQGKGDEAQSLLKEFIGYYSSNRPSTARELTLIAQGMDYLERYQDANGLYQDAREADKNYAEAYIAQGE